MTSTFAERLADAEYALAWRAVRALPHAAAHGLFERGADWAVGRDGAGVRQLRANLARVRPAASPGELDELVRAGMRSYARYWCEAFRLPAMDLADVHARTAVTGTEPLYSALDEGRGVLFALPHTGNWDAAGVWLVEMLRRRGHEPTFTTVGQRLRPESLYRRFVAYREGLGFEVVAAEDGSAAYRALVRRLRGGGVVCLLADRDVSGTGAEVTLFGARTRLPVGPARLAALTGALLLPARPWFRGDGWGIAFGPPVEAGRRAPAAATTQALADALAALIAETPQDWHVLQPVWPEPAPVGVAP
ncbi:phosphatidylinositol mannoside acyltransferase [Pseudonocardia sp. TRM90224]|uniref:phosphatidylinositol mannoside acyltransferase n=1 Tax=Pseudonocardia sp. TRM90224 TaxID=2812678 RepID=UPI001E535B7D|nr:phosphatidylinositol mannoside acyltransferase [Pseudonocardia sp. TRM90224]